jgi:hypothetical protein
MSLQESNISHHIDNRSSRLENLIKFFGDQLTVISDQDKTDFLVLLARWKSDNIRRGENNKKMKSVRQFAKKNYSLIKHSEMSILVKSLDGCKHDDIISMMIAIAYQLKNKSWGCRNK